MYFALECLYHRIIIANVEIFGARSGKETKEVKMRNTLSLTLILFVIAGSAHAQSRPLVVFAFDQNLDALLRIEDRNGDGDTLDAGEVVIYYNNVPPGTGLDNSQGLYALSARSALATDNFAPDNIVYMIDLNGDGDAFDFGEAWVWFDGSLPGGYTLTNPVTLTPGPGGAWFIIDNNTLDATNPEAVYRLEDLNQDGDVNDPNEVSLYYILSPAGDSYGAVTFDIEFDAAGAGYVLDIASAHPTRIDRIAPGGDSKSEYINTNTLYSLTGAVLNNTLGDMGYNPSTDEIIAAGYRGNYIVLLLAFKDRNGNNRIDLANEVRIIWDEALHAEQYNTGAPRDIFMAADGTLLWVDALTDRIWRLIDVNGDGDFNDVGETTYIYDAAQAAAAGQPNAVNLLSVSAAPACPADLDGDGDVDIADLAALLANYGTTSGAIQGNGDLDGDGDVDLSDLAGLLAVYGAEC